jgi:hypothetical protein
MVKERKINKYSTSCCALCQIAQLDNNTTEEAIQTEIDKLTKEMHRNKDVGISYGTGQTAVFTIISPGEDRLEAKLIKLGFQKTYDFQRRKYYPKGALKMFMKDLTNGETLNK